MPSARTWQMLAALVAVAVMIVVLVAYGMRDDAPPHTPSEPHAGAQHHTNEPSVGDQLAPLQPFATAKVGDWIAIETSTKLSNAPAKVTHSLVRIEAVDDQTVTVIRSERKASLEPPEVTRAQRSRSKLTLGELVGNHPSEAELGQLTITDEPHEVSGKTFACKKLTFRVIADLGSTKTSEVEMWISAEVPVDGLVEIRQRFTGFPMMQTNRLVGFGTASGTTFGNKPDGL